MSNILPPLLVHLAQCFGGSLGWAIVTLSLCIRVALLPLTFRLSRRMIKNQRIMRTMKPELEELKKRLEKKPEQMFSEMQKIYKKHGYTPFDLPALLGSFVQLPIFAFLYRAIREAISSGGPFLWIRSIASPDAALVFIILALTGTAAYVMPNGSESAKSTIVLIQVAMTCFIVWKLAAGLGLYWAASSFISLGQNLWIRSRMSRNEAIA